MNIFKRVILWNILYYAMNTFTLFYIDAKGGMAGIEGYLLIIPVFILSFSTEIWGKRFKGTKFYKYGIFDTSAKFTSIVCAVLVYMQVAEEFWRIFCIVVYFVCMAASIIFMIMILRCEKLYPNITTKKHSNFRNADLSDKLDFK